MRRNIKRTMRQRRLHIVRDKLQAMERDLELHEAMGQPAWLNQPEKYAQHVERVKRFREEHDTLERQLAQDYDLLDLIGLGLMVGAVSILLIWAAITLFTGGSYFQ